MKKNSMLKTVNIILGVLLINQVLMGLLHEILPHRTFKVLHGGGGFVFAVIAIIHIILNWSWIKVNFFRKNSEKQV